MVSLHTAHEMRQHKISLRRMSLSKDSFVYTRPPQFKSIYHSEHLPATIGILTCMFGFAMFSLQLALTPFISLEQDINRSLAQYERARETVAYIAANKSETSLAQVNTNHSTIQPSNNELQVLGASTSTIGFSFFDALKASVGDIFTWPSSKSRQTEVFLGEPAMTISIDYESLPKNYNPKQGEEFALVVNLVPNNNNITSLNLGLAYSELDFEFLGGSIVSSFLRNNSNNLVDFRKYSSQTNYIGALFENNPDNKVIPSTDRLLQLRFKRISPSSSQIQFVKYDLAIDGKPVPVKTAVYSKFNKNFVALNSIDNDINGDGRVDFRDVILALNGWGTHDKKSVIKILNDWYHKPIK